MSMTYEECEASHRANGLVPKIPSHVMEQFSLKGKVCVVTGGSRGIGFSVAEGFAEAGAQVITVSTSNTPSLEDKAMELANRCGTTVEHRVCNVAECTQVEPLVAGVREDFGRIDVFVANAGICIPKPILEQSMEEYHDQINVNVHGVVYCAKSVGCVFRNQGHGNFIITGSISGQIVTVPLDHTAYNTTKAAVTHLGKSLAREWRDFARVNIVAPGWVNTEMSTCEASISEAQRMAVLGRQGDVKEMKAAYLYLANNAICHRSSTLRRRRLHPTLSLFAQNIFEQGDEVEVEANIHVSYRKGETWLLGNYCKR